MQKDRNRCKKMGKDARRWGSTAPLLENAGFPMLQARVLLNHMFPDLRE